MDTIRKEAIAYKSGHDGLVSTAETFLKVGIPRMNKLVPGETLKTFGEEYMKCLNSCGMEFEGHTNRFEQMKNNLREMESAFKRLKAEAEDGSQHASVGEILTPLGTALRVARNFNNLHELEVRRVRSELESCKSLVRGREKKISLSVAAEAKSKMQNLLVSFNKYRAERLM
jgi:hypothetical protein